MSPPFEYKPSIIAAMSSVDGSIDPIQMNVSLSPSRKFGPRKLCRICAEEATSNHFGALSCHACAAFFRRTVAFRRSYTCRHQQNCKLINVSPRRMCKYCRLAKCLSIGMQPSEVRSNGLGTTNGPSISASRPESTGHSDQPSSSSSNAQSPNQPEILNSDSLPLSALLNQKTEMIFNRNMFSNNNTGIPLSEHKPEETFSLLRAMILESAVCTAFLNRSGLVSYLSGHDKQTLLDEALMSWINMDVCKFTVINNGLQLERAFCINDQFIDINLQFLEKYHGLNKNVRDPRCLSKLMKTFYDRIQELARLLEKNKLDEYEFAALAQLTLIRIACETSENVSETQINLAPYVSALTKDIQKYYAENYANENSAAKLNRLIVLVGESHELRQSYNKQILALSNAISAEINFDSPASSAKSSFSAPSTAAQNWMPFLDVNANPGPKQAFNGLLNNIQPTSAQNNTSANFLNNLMTSFSSTSTNDALVDAIAKLTASNHSLDNFPLQFFQQKP
uniref:Nuclear receptor domain-containing protein n=1 Tax=Panagrolaimus sp. JU765 TaxID=591449 RepID=A0AC34R4H5_9BILA